MNRRSLDALGLLALLLAVPALAKAPTHQCTKDGAVIQKKKKDCAAASGKWEPIPTGTAAPKPAAH